MTARWRSTRTEKPDRPMMVMFYYADLVFTDAEWNVGPMPSPDEPWRDERYVLGFWDGAKFCDLGTGHDSFEPELAGNVPESCPTHWAPVPPPPAVTDDNRHEEA